MLRNVAFVGGIHGVGKSTICRQICNEINIDYLSASELLKWKDISEDFKNKQVKNIGDTQDRLIIGLENTIKKNKFYLLDGHYCLINTNNEITDIPLKTFKEINPISLNLILGNISEVKQRLEKRDNKPYDYELLDLFQNKEIIHAKYISETLGIPLNIGYNNDYSIILTALKKTNEMYFL